MRKIKELLAKGWQVDFRQANDSYYDVGATHNGEDTNVEGVAKTLNEAINEMYDAAKARCPWQWE